MDSIHIDRKLKDAFHNTWNIDELKLLIESGVDVNCKDCYGLTKLMDSVYENKIEVIKFLLEQSNIDINSKNGSWEIVPIMVSRDITVIEMLVKAGADINAKDKHGTSVVMHLQNSDMVRYLASIGADLNVKNNDNKTIFDMVPEFCLTDYKIKQECHNYTKEQKIAIIKHLMDSL